MAGIVAYDKSRFNRDTAANSTLLSLCIEHGVEVATVADGALTPGFYKTATGQMVWEMGSVVDATIRRMFSEKMRRQAALLFESGRQRGPSPFGYRSARDDGNRRVLEAVPQQAEAVRTLFAYLAEMPLSQVAAALNRDGVPYIDGRMWTKDAVRDVWRRRRLYIGMAVRKRSLEERPGTHPPILTEDEYSAAVLSVEGRRRSNSAPKRTQRVYLLRGVVFCSDCGTR